MLQRVINTSDEAEYSRETQRRRNNLTIRVARIKNGYLFTRMDTGEAESAPNLKEVYELIERFFAEKMEEMSSDFSS